MQVTPIIFNNISNVQPTCLKSRESNQEQPKQAVVTNPIIQNKVMPSADLLKSYVGIKEPKAEQKQELSAYDYLLTLPNVKQTFKTELAAVAKVMEKMDVESSNTEMMVNLVAEGKLWRGVLRYFCENGKMSKNMESDVDLIYNAYADGKKPIDAYVPTVQDKQAGIKSVKVGDTFEVDGEKNIYFKDSDDNARQLKVSKETFAELFPPAERFAGVQGAAGDCYLLATLNTMIENPQKRGVLYDMFEETDNSVNVTIPTGETVYSAPKNDLRQGIDKWQHMQGATGMILAEHAYGVELQHRLENEFHTFMNSEIARMEKDEPENLTKINGYKQRLADFDEKSKDAEYKPVLMRFENPDANGKLTLKTDENGVMFKDLKSANKEVKRKLSTLADFYRGSIGGDLDVVMRDFGNEKVEEFKTANAEQNAKIKALLMSDDADKYIFTAGALSDGTLTEKPIAKEYSVYGCHAYKIEPFKDKDGQTKFYVENPWNATQNSVMGYDKLSEFFEIICVAEV